MPNRPTLFLLASWLVLPGLASAQESTELTPEKVAEIRRDEAQAQGKVNEAFGNRKPSEMSNEERAQAIEKQQAASAAVLEKHGVSAKDYARYEARMGPEGNARAKAEQKRLEEQAQVAKQTAPVEEKTAEDVPVQAGFSDADMLEMEVTGDEEPINDLLGIPGAEDGESVPVEIGTGATEEKPAVKRAPARSGSSGVKKRVVKRRRGSGGNDS
jgi:hypothetical protein